MTFLLSEDKALRLNLQGMTVNDQRATGDDVPRQVSVFFGQPDQEIRNQSYPYITIDMIDITRDVQREMRGKVNDLVPTATYLAPSDLAEGQGWEIDLPIPVNIDYQITSYARQPRHDRELLAQLLYNKLPLRFGQLPLDDGTVRRLEVLDYSKRDITEQAKRLFVNAVTVRVVSEVSQGTLATLTQVQNVNIDPVQYTTP
jgi:hypothetical protein